MKIIILLLCICSLSLSAMEHSWGNHEQTYGNATYNEPVPARPPTPIPTLTKSQEMKIEQDKRTKEKRKWLLVAGGSFGAAVLISGAWIYSHMGGGTNKKRR